MKRKGWEYEQTGHEHFEERYGLTRYFPSQWFTFQRVENNQIGYCQTDGLLFEPEERSILLFEFKLKHTPQAYFQIEDKYVPVLRKIFPDWTLRVCEVVHWFDPATSFPVEVKLTPDPLTLRPNEFGVHIFNP